MADVTGVEETIGIDGRARGLLVVEVALHDLGAADPDLAVLVGSQILAAGHVDDLAFRVRERGAHGPGDHLGGAVGHGVADRARLGEAVALADPAADALAAELRSLRVQRRRP